MKNTILIIIVLFLYVCGYSSIYLNQSFNDIKINITKTEGDREMNNLIKNELKLYSNKDSTNIYNLKINTVYKKEILTKNTSWVITDYRLSATSIFSLSLKDKIETFKFEENINIKSQTDTFEQNVYEENIKRNFASSIREKLISGILSLNDN